MPTQELLVVSENGYGKRSELQEYRITNRGGKGVQAMKVPTQELLVVSENGYGKRSELQE